MKKMLSVLLSMVLVLSLAACGSRNTQPAEDGTAGSTAAESASVSAETVLQEEPSASETAGTAEESETTAGTEDTSEDAGSIIVTYFSWSGNTEEMASYIAEQTGGDLLKIEPKVAYPTDYNETGDIAKVERDENTRPEIANLPVSIDEYDTILVGYPIWWHTAPMIIGTFLENYDLTGKEVYPFTQSASMDTGQFNQSIEFVREASEGATVHDGMFARPSDTSIIDAYLFENGLVK